MPRKFLIVVLSIAGLMRALFIWRAPLWYDENFTLLLARLSLMNMFTAAAGDVHPPLWYLVEWGIFHVIPAAPAWFLRLPAMICSIASLWVFIKIVIALDAPASVSQIAVVMMAILPMQIWYAQEGRMYAMLEMFVLMGAYIVITKRYAGYLWLVFVLMFYTHNYGIIYVSTLCVVAMLAATRETFINTAKWLAVNGVGASLLYIPWAYVVSRQMAGIAGHYWLKDVSAGIMIKSLYYQFWVNSMLAPGLLVSYIFSLGMLLLGVYVGVRVVPTANFRYVFMLAMLPFLLAWTISIVWQPIILPRAFIGTSPFLYLIIAWSVKAFERAKSPVFRVSLLYSFYIMALLCVFGLPRYYSSVVDMKAEGAKLPILDKLTYVQNHWRDGDILYYTDDGPAINIMPYTDLPQYRMPECGIEKTSFAPVFDSLSNVTRRAIGMEIVDLADIPYKRAWIFAPRSPFRPQCYYDQVDRVAHKGQQAISGVWLVEAE